MINLVLGTKLIKSEEYTKRKTVKAVIVEPQTKKILLLSNLLIGGGVEKNESNKAALAREAIEEAGVKIEIIKILGKAIQYRNFINKKYISTVYLCKYISTTGKPTTFDKIEQKAKLSWKTLNQAVNILQFEIDNLLMQDSQLCKNDIDEAKLYNRQTTLFFLQKAIAQVTNI